MIDIILLHHRSCQKVGDGSCWLIAGFFISTGGDTSGMLQQKHLFKISPLLYVDFRVNIWTSVLVVLCESCDTNPGLYKKPILKI